MAQILAYVTQILGLIVQILPLVQQVREFVSHAAQETGPKVIEGFVSDTYRWVTHASWGLQVLKTDIAAIDTRLDTTDLNIAGVYAATQVIIDDIAAIPGAIDYTDTLAEILAAINGLPVPPTPPAVGDIAEAVWNWQNPASNYQQWELQSFAGMLGLNFSSQAVLPLDTQPMFGRSCFWPTELTVLAIGDIPNPDWGAILPEDTRLTWLQRTDIGNTWDAHTTTGEPVAYWLDADDVVIAAIYPLFTDAYLHMARTEQLPPPTSGLGAPIWPGIANVTVGEPSALADGLVVLGPMDGLLLNVTGHPSGSGKFAFGDIASWRYLGAVIFVSDNGDAEWPSQIGPEQQVIVPRAMVSAASAVFRLNSGFTGTVTPWTATSGI